jgi:hypothetical protein
MKQNSEQRRLLLDEWEEELLAEAAFKAANEASHADAAARYASGSDSDTD